MNSHHTYLLQAEGKDLPLLYTISRDGAIFSWKFTPRPKGMPRATTAPKKGQARGDDKEEGAEEDEEEEEEEEEVEHVDPSVFPFLARGSWSLSEKHFTHQRMAKVR